MKSGSSWTLKGRGSDARAGTDRAGASVGDWLNSVVESEDAKDAPPLSDFDDQSEAEGRPPPQRHNEPPTARNDQAWWQRWRSNGGLDAEETPRRQPRPPREPAGAAPARATTAARPELREGAARRRPVQRSRQQVNELHGRLNELSEQLQRLASKHSGTPGAMPRRPMRTARDQRGDEPIPALTGAPPLRQRQSARPAGTQYATAEDNSVYGAASVDDVVAEIMARQRMLDGEPAPTPPIRKPSANVAPDPAPLSRVVEDTASAKLAIPEPARPEAARAEAVAAPALLVHEPLLPDASFDMAPAREPAKERPAAFEFAADAPSPEDNETTASTAPLFKPVVTEVAADESPATAHQDDHATDHETRVQETDREAPAQEPVSAGGATDVSPVQRSSGVTSATSAYLGSLEQHLRDITSRIEALRPSDQLEQAVSGLRADLAEISHLITEALPRQAMESLQIELKALGDRIDQSRQYGVDGDALAALERGLNEVRDVLLALTPAENLVGFHEAVQALAQKVDLIVAKDDPAALQQLEAAIGGLRGIVSHVASNETLNKVADDVRALSARVDSLASIAASGPDLSALGNRIEVLANAVTASTEAGQAVPRELEKLLIGLIEKLEWVQLTHTDHAAMAQLENRIGRLVQRFDDTEARFSQLDTVEQGLADVIAHVEDIRGPATGISPPVPPAFVRDVEEIRDAELRTQDSLEAVQSTVEHVVDRLAMIETNLRDAPPRAAAVPPPLPVAALEHQAPPTVPEAEDENASPRAAAAGASTRSAPASTRKALDPSLPPDHPLEPGRARMSAADRIAASEAVTPSAKPPVIDDPGGKSNFIAAARRAALAAAAEPYAEPIGGKPVKTAAARTAAAVSKLPQPPLRTLIVAGVAALIVVGGLYFATKWFGSHNATPLRITQPEQTAPSDTTPPDAAPSQPQPEMPTPPAASVPAPRAAPTAPDSAPPNLPMSPQPRQSSSALPDTNPGAPSVAAGSATSSPASPPSAQPSLAAPASVAASAAPAVAALQAAPPQATAPMTIVPAPANAMPADKLPAGISPALRSAALAGDAAAAYEVALRFIEGRGVTQSNELAVFWLDRAAKQGLVPAQFRLGGMYEKGAGAKKDLTAARGLYMAAAEKGNGKAMHNLAVLYAEGVDGAPDYRTAALWFRKAADRGIVDSQYNLAILYVRGFGVEQDYAESYKWFALASLLGDKDAGKKSEEVATHLDPQTLAAAKLAVTNWKAEPQPEDAITVPAPPGGWDAAAANPATPKARRGGPKASAPAAEPKVN